MSRKSFIIGLAVFSVIIFGTLAGLIYFNQFDRSIAMQRTGTAPTGKATAQGNKAAGQLAEKDIIGEGYALYTANCAECHGNAAQGQNPQYRSGGRTPDGGFIAPALNGTAHSWHHPDQVLFDYINTGSPEVTSPMRGHGDQLSNDQIWMIIAFIKSLWTEEMRQMQAKASNR